MAQQDKLCFNYNKLGYNEIAQKRYKVLYAKEMSNNVPLYPNVLIDKYKIVELDFISIPIFSWKKQSYKCGDNLEPLIAFEQDFLFQEVIIVTQKGNIRVGVFDIFDSYNEENRRKDSISNIEFSLHGRPVQSDTKKIEKKIHKYILENPDVFVFIIKGLHGYWAIIEGELVKLVARGCKIKGEQGSYFICKRYGQEYINDIITDSFRMGYKYLSCSDCEISKTIKIEITD